MTDELTPYRRHAANTEALNDVSVPEQLLAFPAVAATYAATAFWNSGVELAAGAADFVGATGVSSSLREEKVDTADTIANVYGSRWSQYYQDNIGAAELVGDIGSLFVGGSTAFKLLNKARSGQFGALAAHINPFETGRELWKKKALAADIAYQDYSKVWSASRKAMAFGVPAALLESAQVTAFTYTVANENTIFDNYDLKSFVFDSALGGGLGLVGRVLQDTRAGSNIIRDFERKYNTENGFTGAREDLAPWQNVVRLAESRVGKQFTEARAETLFDNELSIQLRGLSADKNVADTFLPTIKDYIKAGDTLAIRNLLQGAEKISYASGAEAQALNQARLNFFIKNKYLEPIGKDGKALVKFSEVFDPEAKKSVLAAQLTGKEVTLGLRTDLAENLMETLGLAADDIKQLDNVLEVRAGSIFRNGETGKLVYLPNSSSLELLQFGGKPAVDLYNELGGKVPGFFDSLRGSVKDLAAYVPTAGDVGKKIKGSLIDGTEAAPLLTKAGKLFSTGRANAQLLKLDPAQADALHILSTEAGRNVDLARKLFGAPIRNPAAGPQIIPAAFPQSNLFGLQAAYEYATQNGGKAWVFKKAGEYQELDLPEIGSLLRGAKDVIAKGGLQKGYSLEALERYSGAQLLDGEMKITNIYSGKTLEQNLAPRHAAITYNLDGFPTRAEYLAKVDTAVMKLANEEAFAAAANRSVGDVLPVDRALEYKRLLVVDEATTQAKVAGAFRFGEGGLGGEIENVASTIGSLTANAKQSLKNLFGTKFADARRILTTNVVDYVEYNAIASKLMTRAVSYALREDLQGQLRFFDTKAAKFAEDLPPLTGRTAEYFRKLYGDGGLHREYAARYNELAKARGAPEIDPQAIYIPQMPGKYFLQVQSRNGVAYVNAASEEGLGALRDQVQRAFPDATIRTRFEIGQQKKAEGIFASEDFFNNVQLDQELRRQNFAQVLATPTDDRFLVNMADFYDKQAAFLVESNVKNIYADEIATLKQRQEIASGLKTSAKGGVLSQFFRKDQKFQDIVNTMLDRSLRSDIPVLDSWNNAVNDVFAAGYRATVNTLREAAPNVFAKDAVVASKAGAEINATLAKYNELTDYRSLATNLGLTQKEDLVFGQKAVNGLNSFFVTWQLNVDAANTLVNALSFTLTTLPEIRNLQKSLVPGASVQIPGTALREFSYKKAAVNAIGKLNDPALRKDLLEKHFRNGVISKDFGTYAEASGILQDDFARYIASQGGASSQIKQKLSDSYNAFTEASRKILVQKPNEYLRLLSAEIADDLLRASGITDEAYIGMRVSQYVKRTQHAFPYAQRPAIMQGPIGAAISLYQTFFFNTVQNLTRYVAEGDKVAVRTFLAAQTGTFGLSSNPVFHAINQSIARRKENTTGTDIYGNAQRGEDTIGDWILYGPVSAGLKLNLYSRGDLTPRNLAVLPTDLAAVPFISQTIKAGSALTELGQKINQGAPGGTAFLEAVQQMGISRPLAGVASMFLGETIDNAGRKVTDTKVFELASLARIAGARPFEEAKLINANSRIIAQQLYDQQRVSKFGEVLRTRLRAGEEFTGEEFKTALSNYIQSGGEAKNFSSYMKKLIETTEAPLANRMVQKLRNDPDTQIWMQFLEEQQGPQTER